MTQPGPNSPKFALLPPDRPADAVDRELLVRSTVENLFAHSLAARPASPRWVFFA